MVIVGTGSDPRYPVMVIVPAVYDYRPAGLKLAFSLFVLFYMMVNSTRFSSGETPDAERSPDYLASSGNSLLSMIMQLSMSIGVTIAGLLLNFFGLAACQGQHSGNFTYKLVFKVHLA